MEVERHVRVDQRDRGGCSGAGCERGEDTVTLVPTGAGNHGVGDELRDRCAAGSSGVDVHCAAPVGGVADKRSAGRLCGGLRLRTTGNGALSGSGHLRSDQISSTTARAASEDRPSPEVTMCLRAHRCSMLKAGAIRMTVITTSSKVRRLGIDAPHMMRMLRM